MLGQDAGGRGRRGRGRGVGEGMAGSRKGRSNCTENKEVRKKERGLLQKEKRVTACMEKVTSHHAVKRLILWFDMTPASTGIYLHLPPRHGALRSHI